MLLQSELVKSFLQNELLSFSVVFINGSEIVQRNIKNKGAALDRRQVDRWIFCIHASAVGEPY
jgi:hypothetical protein